MRDFKRKLHAMQINNITMGMAPEVVEQIRKEQAYTDVRIDKFRKAYANQLTNDKLEEIRYLREEIERLKSQDEKLGYAIEYKEKERLETERHSALLKQKLNQQQRKEELQEDFVQASKYYLSQREGIQEKRTLIRARTIATQEQKDRDREEIEKLKIYKAQLMAEVAIYSAMIGQEFGGLDFPSDGFADPVVARSKSLSRSSSSRSSSVRDWLNKNDIQRNVPITVEQNFVKTESTNASTSSRSTGSTLRSFHATFDPNNNGKPPRVPPRTKTPGSHKSNSSSDFPSDTSIISSKSGSRKIGRSKSISRSSHRPSLTPEQKLEQEINAMFEPELDYEKSKEGMGKSQASLLANEILHAIGRSPSTSSKNSMKSAKYSSSSKNKVKRSKSVASTKSRRSSRTSAVSIGTNSTISSTKTTSTTRQKRMDAETREQDYVNHMKEVAAIRAQEEEKINQLRKMEEENKKLELESQMLEEKRIQDMIEDVEKEAVREVEREQFENKVDKLDQQFGSQLSMSTQSTRDLLDDNVGGPIYDLPTNHNNQQKEDEHKKEEEKIKNLVEESLLSSLRDSEKTPMSTISDDTPSLAQDFNIGSQARGSIPTLDTNIKKEEEEPVTKININIPELTEEEDNGEQEDTSESDHTFSEDSQTENQSHRNSKIDDFSIMSDIKNSVRQDVNVRNSELSVASKMDLPDSAGNSVVGGSSNFSQGGTSAATLQTLPQSIRNAGELVEARIQRVTGQVQNPHEALPADDYVTHV